MVIKWPAIDKRKKKEEEVIVKPKAPKTPAVIKDKGTPIEETFIKKGGEFFRVGEREKAELMRRGKLTPEEALPIQAETRAEQARQVGQVEPVTDIPMLPTDVLSYGQAAKSALGLTAAGVAGGAAVGAVGGAPIGGVGAIPGAIIGATVGGISTFIGGFRANLKQQRKDMLSGESANIRKQEQNMLKLVMDVNRGGDPARNLEYFNDQLTLVDENHARLKLKTTDDLSLWLGEDGHTQMERYEVFNSSGGMRDILISQMRDAIRNPNLLANVQLESWLSEGETEK